MPTTARYSWTTPASTDPNDVPLDMAGLAAQVEATVGGIADKPLCRIYQTANQTIAASTTSSVTCTTQIDKGGFGAGTGSWARTVPVAGFYRVTAQAFWGRPASGSGYGRVQIEQGATVLAMAEGGLSTSVFDLSVMADVVVELAAGAEVMFRVRQSTAVGVECKGGDPYRTWMSIEFLRGS